MMPSAEAELWGEVAGIDLTEEDSEDSLLDDSWDSKEMIIASCVVVGSITLCCLLKLLYGKFFKSNSVKDREEELE